MPPPAVPQQRLAEGGQLAAFHEHHWSSGRPGPSKAVAEGSSRPSTGGDTGNRAVAELDFAKEEPHDMKPFLAGLIVLALIGVAVLVLFPSVLHLDTKYSPGYTAQAFRSIKIGDTQKSVISRLGPAFDTNECEPYVQWIYSADKQSHFQQEGEASGTYTMVRFQKGAVVEISGVTVRSSTLISRTMTFGEGSGYLKLTHENIEALKGASQDLVKEKLGAPHAVYESKSRQIFSYSRSPSGGNYRLRQIEFDGAAK